MKVGIMTMHRILNYGSYMQALSLKKMVESLGHEVVFVDYKPGKSIYDLTQKPKGIKNKIKKSNLWKKMIGLYQKYVLHTKLISDEEMLKMQKFQQSYPFLGVPKKPQYNTKVDVLIIGSDEVFNCLQDNDVVGYSLELFGKNHNAKKLASYAASFGYTTYDSLKAFGKAEEIGKYLKKFDALSVRDKNSHDLATKLTEKFPELHLDPVLVGYAEKMEWSNVDMNGYAVVYGYANRFSDEEGKQIQEFAHQKGLKTVALCEPQSFCDESIRCRPDEILSYFKNASYVITDTFHGIIFSVINHIPFVAYCRESAQSNVTNREKMMDLLERLGLTDRLHNNGSGLEEILDKPIDFVKTDEIRAAQRARSLEYLKNITN